MGNPSKQFLLVLVQLILVKTVYTFRPSFVAPKVSLSSWPHRNMHSDLKTRNKSDKQMVLMMSSYTSQESTDTKSSQPLPPVISIDNLSCSHDGGTTYQLNDVSYVLPRGAKVGLLGRNGCGKSTFLQILAMETCDNDSVGSGKSNGNDIVFNGNVVKSKDCRVAFVEQEPPMPSDVSVASALLGVVSTDASSLSSSTSSSMSPYEAVRRYKVAEANAETNPDAFSRATSLMDTTSGWSVLTKAEEVATKLRVDHLLDMPLSSISGGERKRVALAAALVQEPDVLMLDEPTNHLDLSAIRWLSDLILEDRKMTVLTVTHDRAFLDQVCRSGMLELDRGSLYSYEGTYADFLEKKDARLQLEDAAVSSAKAKYRVELEWMRRQPQARQSKSKARIDAFYTLEKSTKARATDPNLSIQEDGGKRRIGNNILKCKDVSLSFGERNILNSFTYDFNRGDKIGVVGANGVGKSTFLKVLTGEQSCDNGEVSTGETVVFGVYDQMGLRLEDEDQRVMDFVKQRVESADGSSMAEAPQEAMKLLKKFEFQRERWNERVSMLSGGERRRLQLLSVITKRPNFLILDEPTNDVDLDTLSALEKYLDEFNGVLVVVSHDRFFTDKVTDHLFVFEGNGSVKDYLGSLSDYADVLADQETSSGAVGVMSSNSASASSSSGGGAANADKKLLYKEEKEKRNAQKKKNQKLKREINNLEPAIEKLKAKAIEVQTKIDSSSDEGWTVLAELAEKVQALNEEIEEKEMRWLELAEILEEQEEE